jgi:hypothetical protein
MTTTKGDFGIAMTRWTDWQTLLAHVRQMDADGASYREEIAALRAENAGLKVRVNDLVGIVKELQSALNEQSAIDAEYKEQKREIVADVATVSATLQKASEAWADSPELAEQNDALGAGAPGNGIKAAAIIDGIRALLTLADNAGVPRQAMLYLLSFSIKFAEMPEGKMDEFMAHFTGGHDNRDAKKAGGRTRSVSETMVIAQIAAFYAILKKKGVPAPDAKAALAKACGLSEGQHRKILDISTRAEHDRSFAKFYREAETTIEKMTTHGMPPVQAAVGFLRELFNQDPTLLKYIQKSRG